MSRTVAALYDTRAEAELARARLIAGLKAKSPRIIGKDTVAAVDGLGFARPDAEAYRERLRRGGHLVVAEVPSGASAKRIITLLEQSAGDYDEPGALRPQESFHPGMSVEGPVEQAPIRAPDQMPVHEQQHAPDAPGAPDAPQTAQVNERLAPPPELEAEPAAAAHPSPPPVAQELRVGDRQFAGSGARVRAFTRDAPAQEEVVLRDDVVEVEAIPSERRLSENEVDAGGLFKERVFEFAEMREEPVVTKVNVVREEIIVRKTVKERTETIRDTVRKTEIQVEDLPDESTPAFFGGGTADTPTRR